MNKSITLAFAVFLLNSPAIADVCDYRPSQLIGGAGAGALGAVGAGTAAAGLGAQAAGFYTLTHAVTGLTMLGSTAGGASAAGTVGIMGGTAGLVGSIAAVILAPATIVAGAVLGAGVSIYVYPRQRHAFKKHHCHFSDYDRYWSIYYGIWGRL